MKIRIVKNDIIPFDGFLAFVIRYIDGGWGV